jgi:hypothetical protein
MAIVTRHIRRMLAEADVLARGAELEPDEVKAAGTLARAANLAEHAAAELRSEMFEAQGWPVI